MSKSTYVFEFRVSYPEHLIDKILTHKVRAMDEKEAWRRFSRWVEEGDHDEDFELEVATIASSTDPKWIAEHPKN